jgi:hypothetical protein
MKRFSIVKRLACAISLVAVLHSANVWGATAAYYRHEEGVSGQIVPDGLDTVIDSSGNGNHMQTFSSANAPFTAATYSPLVSPLALRSELSNTLSLDFGPLPTVGTEDGGGRNDDNYVQDKLIQTQLFTAMTVELAFNMHTIDGFQSLFGKDGKPLGDDPEETDSPVAPLQIKVRGDDFPNAVPNQLFVEWIDGDGDIHILATGETVAADQWYHIAFTLSATDAELWVAGETGDYVLKGAISGDDFAGTSGEVTIFDPTPITVGRGMFDNNVTDWSDALIDEVRVSDAALTPDQFLFLTAPGGQNGDFDNDGDVDGRDFLVWQRGDSPSPLSAGDLAEWQNAYGMGGLSAVSVPEPTSIVLLFGTIVGSVLVRRRRND